MAYNKLRMRRKHAFWNEVSQEDFPDKDVEGDFQQQQQQGMRCWDEMNSLATAKDLALGT